MDHFKRINDTHGHDAGDRVIRLIAEMLATISDDNCHVARHGGEEFVCCSEASACPKRIRNLTACANKWPNVAYETARR
nr:diguanylate cyclase [Sphingobium sp. LB126]